MCIAVSSFKAFHSSRGIMAKLLSFFVIIGITLLLDLSYGEISRWREFLSKKKILSTRNGGRIAGND